MKYILKYMGMVTRIDEVVFIRNTFLNFVKIISLEFCMTLRKNSKKKDDNSYNGKLINI